MYETNRSQVVGGLGPVQTTPTFRLSALSKDASLLRERQT
jgi:hypothetical protein